jgi:hypothetical protein
MVLSSGLANVASFASAAAPSVAPALATPTATNATPSVVMPSATGIPGENSAGQNPITAKEISQLIASNPAIHGVESAYRNGPPANTTPLSSPTAGTARAAGSSGLGYGWITGTVVDAEPPYGAISGAVILPTPVAGFCPPVVGCQSTESGATGQFTVPAAVGQNEVTVSDSFWLTNRTWAFVPDGGYVNVGAIGLVADGLVSGVVLGDDPAHEPVAGVQITSESRDGSLVGSPIAHTNAQGQFTVAVPPVPSEIQFSPLLPDTPYEPNQTVVNVTSGGSINIGTVYLERSSLVSVDVYDSVAGGIVGVPTAIQICSRLTGYCPAQSEVYGGGYQVTAFAPVGPDTIDILADGYVTSTSVLGIVPGATPSAPPFFMGSFGVVPLGAFSMWANITGVPAPYGDDPPTSVWPVGGFAIVTSCTLDGLSWAFPTPTGNMTTGTCTSACVPPGTQGIVGALPLRDFVTITPDESGCLFPGDPTWPIPGDMPVFKNWGWVNITPDEVTNMGALALLPGTYVEGQVLPASSTGWTVQACSMDEPNICGYGSVADSGYNGSYSYTAPNGCPSGPVANVGITFCVDAPPGPDVVRVSPGNSSQNYTWFYNPPLSWPSLPLTLDQSDQDHSNVVGVGGAIVTGRVLQSLSFTPVPGLPSVQICPAGSVPSAVVCGGGVANATGYFSVTGPPGWDQVTVSAPLYQPNSTWIYVGTHNSTGTILITPYGYVQGQVVDSAGQGLYDASVSLCQVVAPSACAPVGGNGLTGTSGQYDGATPAGPPPVGEYEVKASSPGYTSDWTWVNVTTPGENFTAPTITLQSAVASGSSPALGAWIVGRVIDAQYSIGLPSAVITATPLVGGFPIVISSLRDTGGGFNDSLPIGNYEVSFAATGYYTTQRFLNVSGNASVEEMGTIHLVPYPTVTGQLVITPLAWTDDVTYDLGLGPGQGSVTVCRSNGQGCGPAGIVSTDGFFNASAPAGNYDLVLASGSGGGTGSVAGGFVSAQATVNVTNSTVSASLAAPLGLSVFGIITGSVVNGNATTSATLPVRYDAITADSTFPVDATLPEILTADGTYAIIFPESRGLNMTAGGLGSWLPVGIGISVNGTHQGGSGNFSLEPGATVTLPPIVLEHYGWIDARISNNQTGAPIPYATVSATENGRLWDLPTTFSATGVANGGGFVNFSAPPSVPANRAKVNLTISAPDYSSTSVSVAVNASRTTYVNGTSYVGLGKVRLLPWGWIVGHVIDAKTGRALGGASVGVSDNSGLSGKIGVTTNGLGQFRIDAPPSIWDNLSIALTGYTSNLSTLRIAYGETVTTPTTRLAGDGVVAGRVVAEPADLPVAGATVSVCPNTQPNCATTVTTNSSGMFWLGAAPGLSIINVADAGYVTNSTDYVTVPSDGWIFAGTVILQQYAHVLGTVLGLPAGFALGGATVSLCAPLPYSSGAGACFTSISTLPDGTFDISVAAGTYVLNATAPGYNATFLPVALMPGETLPVGLVFVQQFGSATGVVFGADTDAAVAGGTVIACESWGSGVCFAPVPTKGGGAFVVSGPAGPFVLQANAPGYLASYASVVLTPGTTVSVPKFLLTPIGPNARYTVTGRVTSGGPNGAPIVGAVVEVTGGASGPTDASGNFSLQLSWGTYSISAFDAGFVTQTRSIDVTSSIVGVDFYLSVMAYAVSGVVRDGLTGAPVAAVDLYEGSTLLGFTNSNGEYSVPLANGTHELRAVAASKYAALPFAVDVIGAPIVDSLTLLPPGVTLNGLVVNAYNGLPVASAVVKVTGTTSDGTPWSDSVVSGPGGQFTVDTYAGAYTIVASIGGFTSEQSPLVINGTSSALPVTLALPPSPATASGTSMAATTWVVVAAVSAIVATTLIVVLARVRRPPTGPRVRPAAPPEGSP